MLKKELCRFYRKEAGQCLHEIYLYGAPGFPKPHFDLEFWQTLRWVLEEPVDGPVKDKGC